MAESQTFPSTGELNNDPDIYHILSSSTAGANGHGYKQVWLPSGGNNPSYPYAGGDNSVPPDQWDSYVPDNGFECINKGRMCLADCRDTLYPFSTKIYRDAQICEKLNVSCNGVANGKLTEDESDVILTVGVNHALTGISSYSSMSIYDATYLWGVYTAGDTELEDTVWKYINKDDYHDHISQNALQYIYVYEIRRNCKDITNCIQVPSKPTTDVKAVIPLNDPVVITERMYNNPITHVGPELEDVILPYTIHLKKK